MTTDYFDFERPDIQRNKSGISSGVMLFLNTPEVKKMFNDIIKLPIPISIT